jgi:uncharacterized protein (UPF0212 family)
MGASISRNAMQDMAARVVQAQRNVDRAQARMVMGQADRMHHVTPRIFHAVDALVRIQATETQCPACNAMVIPVHDRQGNRGVRECPECGQRWRRINEAQNQLVGRTQ